VTRIPTLPRAVLVASLALSGPAGAEDPPAMQVVRKLNAVLLGVLEHADSLGYGGRAARVAPAVAEAYDVPFMAEKSIGQHWGTLGEADRRRWIELSREFSIANYAANFDHWSEQTIGILGEEPGANGTTIVRTQIVDPAGETTEMSYRLRPTDGGWKIVDVYLNGTVSELALRRSEYTGIIEREGFPKLAETMQAKIADLAAGRAKR
jgi:phospholipid transport system substrate-binding protein